MEERTERGRAFHVDAAADWKDRSQMVKRIVRGTVVVYFPCNRYFSKYTVLVEQLTDIKFPKDRICIWRGTVTQAYIFWRLLPMVAANE